MPQGLRDVVVLLMLFGTPSVFAASAGAQALPDLGHATLEDLMKIQITSASRKEQPIDEVPAAVFVLTAPPISEPTSFGMGHVLGRWTHRFVDASSLQVQSSATIMSRTDFIRVDEQAFDVEAQYHGPFDRRHDIVAGGGARLMKSATGSSFALSFVPPADNNLVSNVFLPDEMALPQLVWTY